MSGYSAMGKNPAAIAPKSTMMIEITQARTGRSIKKRANMIVRGWSEDRSRGQESAARSGFGTSLVTGHYQRASITFHGSLARRLFESPARCQVFLLPAYPPPSARPLYRAELVTHRSPRRAPQAPVRQRLREGRYATPRSSP